MSSVEQVSLVAQQAKSDVSPFVNGFASALLFKIPRAQIAQAWSQFKMGPWLVDYAALNRDVTTSSLDSLLAWAGLLPPLWDVSTCLAGPITAGSKTFIAAGDSVAATLAANSPELAYATRNASFGEKMLAEMGGSGIPQKAGVAVPAVMAMGNVDGVQKAKGGRPTRTGVVPFSAPSITKFLGKSLAPVTNRLRTALFGESLQDVLLRLGVREMVYEGTLPIFRGEAVLENGTKVPLRFFYPPQTPGRTFEIRLMTGREDPWALGLEFPAGEHPSELVATLDKEGLLPTEWVNYGV